MGIDDLFDKAKDTLAEHSDDVKAGIDKVADFVEKKTDDSGDAKVEEFAEKAKDFLDDRSQ